MDRTRTTRSVPTDATLTETPRLTVYIDRSCSICRRESDALANAIPSEQLEFIDCAAPGFADAAAGRAGLSAATLQGVLHARDANGRWLRGADAVAAMYRMAGLQRLAALFDSPWLRWLSVPGYWLFVRSRGFLKATGLASVYLAAVERILQSRANPKQQNDSDQAAT
ncbi:MAG: DCC1-like thiol-disulfide oxidoreductase family protein [Pseudomonadota bacterium]